MLKAKSHFLEILFYRKLHLTNLQHNSILKHFSLKVLHVLNFIISECTNPNMNVLFHPPPHVPNESSILSILSLDISIQIILPATCLSACSGGIVLVFIILSWSIDSWNLCFSLACFIFSLEQTPPLLTSWEKLQGQ